MFLFPDEPWPIKAVKPNEMAREKPVAGKKAGGKKAGGGKGKVHPK